jgi:predicted helicase
MFYARRPEFEIADEKLAFLGQGKLRDIAFDEIRPDGRHNWLNLAQNDFDALIPSATKETKAASKPGQEKAIFKLFSLGVVTNRDEWVYDDDEKLLARKVNEFIKTYESERVRWQSAGKPKKTGDFVSRTIKWTSELEAHLANGDELTFDRARVRSALYRPFCKRFTYYDSIITHRVYQQDHIFPVEGAWKNTVIAYTQPGSQKPFTVGASDCLLDLHFVGAAAGTECLPRYRYENGRPVDNVTDWALDQLQRHYKGDRTQKGREVTKDAIFNYVYAVLHDPIYREKYALNLKREFPRIPFYKDFWQWAEWGKELMDLHIGYESVTPAKLKRIDVPDEKTRKVGLAPKCLLKADKDGGRIMIDSETTLTGIPPEAWNYKLGNRSALEWILDQYKEKKPKDPTIREKFNTYRFADYKEKVIDLLTRVTAVSVRTVAVLESMKRDYH